MFRTMVLALIFVIYIFPILVQLFFGFVALLLVIFSSKRTRIILGILLFIAFIS